MPRRKLAGGNGFGGDADSGKKRISALDVGAAEFSRMLGPLTVLVGRVAAVGRIVEEAIVPMRSLSAWVWRKLLKRSLLSPFPQWG